MTDVFLPTLPNPSFFNSPNPPLTSAGEFLAIVVSHLCVCVTGNDQCLSSHPPNSPRLKRVSFSQLLLLVCEGINKMIDVFFPPSQSLIDFRGWVSHNCCISLVSVWLIDDWCFFPTLPIPSWIQEVGFSQLLYLACKCVTAIDYFLPSLLISPQLQEVSSCNCLISLASL